MMKRILLALCAAICMASCSKPEVDFSEPELTVNFTNTSGNWLLIQWNDNKDIAGVKITLKNKEFTLTQNVGSMYETSYTGTYNLLPYEKDENLTVIRGMYDYTFEFWNHSYIITSLTASKMTWVAEDNPEDIYIYQKY